MTGRLMTCAVVLLVSCACVGRTLLNPTRAMAFQDAPAAAEGKYGSAEEAYRVASAYLSLREYAKSREPLEAALKLAPDDKYRIQVYRALLPVYTQIDNWLPKVEALEFIIQHSEQPAERSQARGELISFIRNRGKTEAAVKRYEERLKETKEDAVTEATLYILIEVYSRLQNDPRKAAERLEQFAALQQKTGRELAVGEAAQLAGEYVKAKKFKEGAELFEQTAKRDEALAAWHYKEAAAAWLKAPDKTRALAAAKLAATSAPEKRGELLEHFWHRGVADVYFETGEYVLAIPHYEQAIAKTKIEGYVKDCEKRLAEARQKASGDAKPASDK
ncbi:MAG TPA: hypothetical protein VM165_02600 [Planctomycetaceae bacterium]|nr:hypothetical protein [Planctomycetaceae bacterium]